MTRWTIGIVAGLMLAGTAQAQYGPRPGYGPPQGGYGYGEHFWQGAPADPRARIDFLQRRIDRGIGDGSLDRREAKGAIRELDRIRDRARDLYRRDRGQLSGGSQADLERRLDDLSRRLRWDRRTY